MGQIHSRKSITASADTDPQFEVHDQELMQIPLPLARLGASSACFLSNGLQWNSFKMTRNMFWTKSYIKDVPVPRSVKLIVHQMRPARGRFMPSAQESVALKLIWQERQITRLSLVSPNESGPSQSRNDKQRCWRGCTILFGNSLVIH